MARASLKDGAVATVNGEAREFSPADGPTTYLRVERVPKAPPAPAPARPPLVSVELNPDLQAMMRAAQRVGHIGEKAADLLGPIGLAAAVGLVAYGGYRWYKKQVAPPRRKQRRLRADLLPTGGKAK